MPVIEVPPTRKSKGLGVAYHQATRQKPCSGAPTWNDSAAARGVRQVLPSDKLDRLARSSCDLHNILHDLEELSCGFLSLGESWCDTTTEVGRLMLTIMGGIAEFERNLIRKRYEEGIERAKRKGRHVRPEAEVG
jgi:DNA invertase Pin-like site-specific DNA recombinase